MNNQEKQAQNISRETDEDLLSLIAFDAFQGIDIESQYPDFYRKMMSNELLHEAFLDMLMLLAEHPESVPVTAVPSPDTTQSPFANLQIKWPKPHQWQLIWEQTTQQLALAFGFTPSEQLLRTRDDTIFYEDDWYSLFHGDIDIEEQHYHVTLEGTRRLEASGELDIVLMVMISADTTVPAPSQSLLATLTWGSYTEAIDVTPNQPINFPPIQLQTVVDMDEKRFKEKLLFNLEPT